MRLLTLLTSLIFILSACGAEEVAQEEIVLPEVEVMTISSGGTEEFRVNGEVSAKKAASLTAELRGNVQAVYVKAGDKVRAGQTLVQITSASVQDSLSTAGSSYTIAQSSLNQTRAANEKNIQSAKIALDNAETSLKNLLIQNEKTRKQAEETLNNTKLSYNLSASSANTTLKNSIASLATAIQSARTTADEIVGISALYENANDDYENNLGALNSKTLSDVEEALRIFLGVLPSLEETYESTYTLGKQAEEVLKKTRIMLNNSSTGTNYSESDLNSDISTVTTELSSLQTSLATLESAKANYDQTLNATNGDSQTIINAQAQYESTLAGLQSSEDNARSNVESARAAYEAAIASAELAEKNAESSLTAASGSYSQAQITRNKLVITAPFSGTVVDIPVKAGDEVNVNELVAEVENAETFTITAYLTASQVQGIKRGDKVKIGKKSEDTIDAVASTVDPATRKYKVEIDHVNSFLHSGQVIPVTFTKTRTDRSGTYVPLVAVHIVSEGNFVWTVNEDDTITKTFVELGEISGSDIAILSGLEEDDVVVISGGRMLKQEGTEVVVL